MNPQLNLKLNNSVQLYAIWHSPKCSVENFWKKAKTDLTHDTMANACCQEQLDAFCRLIFTGHRANFSEMTWFNLFMCCRTQDDEYLGTMGDKCHYLFCTCCCCSAIPHGTIFGPDGQISMSKQSVFWREAPCQPRLWWFVESCKTHALSPACVFVR